MTDQTLAKLRELLLNEFSEQELASLCQDIGINYDALPGAGTFGKTREIVEAARVHDKLRLLHSRLRELRPEAYAASGIVPAAAATATTAAAYQAPVPAAVAAQTLNPRTQSSRNASAFPFQALAVVLVVLLCAVVGLALLLPRLTTPTVTAPNPVVNDPLAPGATTPVAGPTTAPPNDSAITVSQAVTDAAAAGNVLAPVEPMTAAMTPGPDGEQSPAPVLTDTTAAQPVIMPTIAPVPVGPEAEAAVSPASVVTDTSGPLAAIRDLNEQLPAFYTGRATATDLEAFWSGDALRSVMGFGDTRLPRAMRIQPAQRNALNVTYQYLRPPAVSNQSGANAVVTSREAWRYANAVNETEICEVRDYVYNLANDGARWQVQRFRSNLLESGCQPQ